MKNIILAAGYATRMYPLTENFPKPLLMVGGETILDRLMRDVDAIEDITEHIIVTNHKFYDVFSKWKEESSYVKPITIIEDGSTTNDNRIGAVRDLLLAYELVASANEALLVLAADNILDFSIKGFVEYYKLKQASLVMCHKEERKEALQRTGVICFDKNNKVTLMEEKPKEPKSHWAVPPFYIYDNRDFTLIEHSIEKGCGFDAPGNLAHYICENSIVYAWQMPGHRYDIGNLEIYEQLKDQSL